MRILKNIFCCILFFGFCHYSFGQTSDAKYNLSSNYIESIFYDRDGKLWIGTDEGLNLITSHDQYQFLADISDDKGILDSEIFKLNELQISTIFVFDITMNCMDIGALDDTGAEVGRGVRDNEISHDFVCFFMFQKEFQIIIHGLKQM